MARASEGDFVWYEHLTRDVGAATAFYGDLLGWKTEPFGDAYRMWVGGQGPLGGVMKLEGDKDGTPPMWFAHVQVDDLDAAVARVRRLGGKVHREPTPIPTVGRFAIVADPQGAMLSLFQPDQAMELHDPAKEGEFCWNELVTSDSEAALRFYQELLGWKVLDELDMGPMGKYRIFGHGDRRLGGMMTAPQGTPMPPAWGYYASTRDLDGAIARATRRGARVTNGPMDVPGGRIAQLADPQGAAFALHEAKAQGAAP